jgi:wyosine [tRNA(Phe)-imidazoG37] synthetase (radical SAM superfamily)
MKYVFGPVPSRRLGFSLGVDILPYKTCSFDCIYCELGPTTCRTIAPTGQVSTEDVLAELETCLASPRQRIDWLTISGSGEPTLHPELGLLIQAIKKKYALPLALITNGSLFFDPSAVEKVQEADLLIPSLDTVDPEAFQVINRPHPELRIESIVEGLIQLGRLPGPRIWLEVLFLRGINDQPDQIEALCRVIEKINPEKVQLNTVVRPPVEAFARALDYRALEAIREIMGPRAEIIASPTVKADFQNEPLESEILALIARRPCTAEDLSRLTGFSPQQTRAQLKRLLDQGLIDGQVFNQKDFFLRR